MAKYNVLAFVTCCIKFHGIEADSPRDAAEEAGGLAIEHGHRVFNPEHWPTIERDGHKIESYGFDDEITDYLVDVDGDETHELTERYWDESSPAARLGAALSRLLNCAELNQDDIEPETVETITAARALLDELQATRSTAESEIAAT